MNQRLIAEIGKSQRLQIVNCLKRTQGLSVKSLSEQLEMSYMGVKQHCIDLEKKGYLDSVRRPNPKNRIGRPELLYRLTSKAHSLFPAASNPITIELLQAAQTLYGPTAPEKLLYTYFQRLGDRYEKRLPKDGDTPLLLRAKAFATLRDQEGAMAVFTEVNDKEFHITEHHSPIRDLLEAYPTLIPRLEQDLFRRVLGATVTREHELTGGLYFALFKITEMAG